MKCLFHLGPTAIEGIVGRREGESASGSESEWARGPLDGNKKGYNTINFTRTGASELKLATL